MVLKSTPLLDFTHGSFSDEPFDHVSESTISSFGHLLRAHTNYTMIKFFLAFEKTNVK
jgi:hypothetical protein